jgi:biopolymer transport protein ExbD
VKYRVKKRSMEQNIAPLIDVVFLLLIFFIVSSTLNIRELRTDIVLPDTNSSSGRIDEHISIYLNREGELFYENEKIVLKSLTIKLEQKKEEINSRGIIIYADKKVPFQWVINVMNIIKNLNIDKLSFALKDDNFK